MSRRALLAAFAVLGGCATTLDCGPDRTDPVVIHATFEDGEPVEDLVVECAADEEPLDARRIEPGLYGCPGPVPAVYGVVATRGAITRRWSLRAPAIDRPCIGFLPRTIELVLPR